MALSSLLNCFKNLSINSRQSLKQASSLLGRSAVESPDLMRGPFLSGPVVLLDFVRHVGKQNPFKYKRGVRPPSLIRWVDKPQEYTTDKLPVRKLAGRDPKTGRIMCAGRGGGHKQKYRWVLFTRGVPKGEQLVEQIHSVNYDPCRTADIALAVTGDKKRWLLATANMKAGDIVKSCSDIPLNPVRPSEGDAWPLGALPVGTVVHSVELFPNCGGYFARAAGTCCQVLRKVGNQVILQVPSKHEVCLSENCMATVGRVSNVNHNKEHIGSAQRNRWFGRRPRSGLWHRKDGYCGRKIRPLPPMKVFSEPKKTPPPLYTLTMQ